VWQPGPVIGGRSRPKSKSLHFATRPRRRFPWRLLVAIVVIIVLAGVAALVRAETLKPPVLTLKRLMPTSVTLPGAPPKPAWPSAGQAAVEVEGLPPVGSSGPNRPVPIASLAKVMTAYVILHDHPIKPGQPGFTVTIGAGDVADYQQRVARGESVLPVAAGEALDEAQLLQGLLVASGNNVATILATRDSSPGTSFVAKMNSVARSLGMAHTTYTDPSGVQSTTVSTASDQLILASRAMAIPVFAGTVALRSVSLPVAGEVANFNRAVGSNGYVGIKTGSDVSSGGCLMFADARKTEGHNITILGVVLGQAMGQISTPALLAAAVNASNSLVASVVAAVAVRTALPEGTAVAEVSGPRGHSMVTTSAGLSVFDFGGAVVPLAMSLQPVGRTLRAGQTVASVAVAGGVSPAVPAMATSSIPGVSLRWRLRHVF
jgi:serine-type D-Ala-D-Ala carboxypeptidase (penicillin-binding protein 5/6)